MGTYLCEHVWGSYFCDHVWDTYFCDHVWGSYVCDHVCCWHLELQSVMLSKAHVSSVIWYRVALQE